MKARSRTIRFAIFMVAAILLVITVVSIVPVSSEDSLGGKADGLVLVRPVFAQSTEASFLEEEAGIAAYVNVGQAIDLARAKGVYRTVEKETESYTIGSVALPDYPPSEDVHAYIQRDGWIMVYYMKGEPTSKIIVWTEQSPNIIGTKFELALAVIGSALGEAVSNLKYYHFGYPNAKKLMILGDTDEFKLTIPGDFSVYERSYWANFHWAYIRWSNVYGSISIDGAHVAGRSGYVGTEIGTFSAIQLKPGVSHHIVLTQAEVALVLLYREP